MVLVLAVATTLAVLVMTGGAVSRTGGGVASRTGRAGVSPATISARISARKRAAMSAVVSSAMSHPPLPGGDILRDSPLADQREARDGVTAGAVSIDPAVKRQTIAEIEPLVPKVVSTHFAEHNFDVVRNPKVNVHYDDARHYLLTTDEKFDAITSDPLDPWVKGAATPYTREFAANLGGRPL